MKPIVYLFLIFLFGCTNIGYSGKRIQVEPAKAETWIPEKAQINMVFSKLERAVKKEAQSEGICSLEWKDYKFQYTGIIENGTKLILVNAFCSDEAYWKEQWVQILDGGSCYFQALYDTSESKFTYIIFNNVA